MIEKPPINLNIEDLYPDLPPEERIEAQENLKAYVNLVWRIYQRHKQAGTLESELEKIRLKEEWEKRNKKY